LRATDQDVDAPAVDVEVGGAEAGDAVDDQKCVGSDFLDELGDGFHVVADGGGGFGSLDVKGLDIRRQGGLDGGEVEGLAIGGGDGFRNAAEGLSQADPAFAEFARCKYQDFIARRGEVRNGGFHGAGAGAGEQQDVVLRADEDFELG